MYYNYVVCIYNNVLAMFRARTLACLFKIERDKVLNPTTCCPKYSSSLIHEILGLANIT